MEGVDDGKEFPVMDLVVHFGRGKGFGVVSYSTQSFGHGRVLLPQDCS